MPRQADPLGADLILDFYERNARELPWRQPDATPWAVLVSEVMLQQTPVSRVLSVYEQWVQRWPSPADLAVEPAGEAIRTWGRLGYPRRAVRLHGAAVRITAEHGGQVPHTVEELLRLPGVGDYTARAVAAFAFGARVPVVDTNVRRVLSRVVRGVDEPRASATAADRAEMATLLPADPAIAARFSVAVMELGALVCTAVSPSCDRCPLPARCAWRRSGAVPGVARRPVQAWHGTDRQARGRMMALLRGSAGPVDMLDLLGSTDDAVQARRCLDSLLADGLVERAHDGWFVLPGTAVAG
ncbi:A/G-specific adenine glycosylase [Nakamurella sp.]|uniref:A/G-specific adenine glycosylase n=1 Tax=Nakamurella sp. TaxID=1869182 RepID=UPI0037843802